MWKNKKVYEPQTIVSQWSLLVTASSFRDVSLHLESRLRRAEETIPDASQLE